VASPSKRRAEAGKPRAGARGSSRGTAAATLDATLAALADPKRRELVDVLRKGELSAGELSRKLALPAPALSRHLRVLRQAGLVSETHPEFDARVRIYSLRLEPMSGLKAWLEETEALWVDQLASFKAYLERG